ncbi:pyridoxal phosphate-dependent aminotransferase [Pseudonocardia acaciae]|uniref:pyridoxal phosphate-dependent aminotransferase n=1 Tax=Pseudonocardia acaciae TaxID=551276 RepID=UPI00048E4A12|nr:aminotransferase class I/II-fold pyridoxal phosphate-dependent enzyme [Pseudonocardia acaciae]
MLLRPSKAITRVRRGSLRPHGGEHPSGTVSLAMGEPDFPTPEPIVEAAVQALRDGYTHYGDLNGDPELRAEIAARATALSGHDYTEESVLVSHGGAGAITSSVLATLDPRDRVVIPEPTYSLYPDAARLAGAEPVFVPTTDDHGLDLDALRRAVRGARMIMLCNPVNPTGAVFGRAELAALGDLLQGTDTLVMADEAYADIVYDAEFVSTLRIESLRERLIYCQTLSKTYAMTGWRVGYVVAPPELTDVIRQAHRTMNSSINAVAQRAALAALRLGPRLASSALDAYRERRDLVVKRLRAMDAVDINEPSGTFYAFARYGGDLPSVEMARRLLRGGVAVRAGSEYGPGGQGHIRLSFAADLDTLDRGLDRIEAVLTRRETP